jgi:hypothetical protein
MIESGLNYEVEVNKQGAQTHFSLAKGTRVKLGNETIVFDERVNCHLEKEIPYEGLVETIIASGPQNAAANTDNFNYLEERENDGGEKETVEIRYLGNGQKKEKVVEAEAVIVDRAEVKNSLGADKAQKRSNNGRGKAKAKENA